jgi:anti-anti-sigma factor
MPDLIISTTPLPDGVRISLQGDAGISDLDLLDVELTRAVSAEPAVVAIDLSQLRFISSAAMGSLLKMRRVVVLKNGIVRLGGATPQIAEAFQRAKLENHFEFVDAD